MSRPVLFLDFDGVLNGADEQRVVSEYVPTLPAEPVLPPLDPHCVSLLNGITEATGAAIVLATWWCTVDDDWRTVAAALTAAGVTAPIIGTVALDARERFSKAASVEAWAYEHRPPRWVWLDDMGERCAGLLQCDSITGLTELVASQAIAILRGET